MSSPTLPDVKTQVLSLKVSELQQCAAKLGLQRSGRCRSYKYAVKNCVLSFLSLIFVVTGRKSELQTRLLGYIGIYSDGQQSSQGRQQWQIESGIRVVWDVYSSSKGARYNAFAAKPVQPFKLPSAPSFNVNSVAKPPPRIVRCICRSVVINRNMLQCCEPSCNVWQHVDCLGTHKINPSSFYCEKCRIQMADPFWEAVEDLLPPARMKHVIGRAPVRDSYGNLLPMQSIERAIYFSNEQMAEVKNSKGSIRIQVACIQVEDEVSFRFHWPKNIVFRTNSIQYRPYGRNSGSSLGLNQRDSAADISNLCLRGRNSVEVTCHDTGSWLLLIQRAKRRSLEGVKKMMAPPESLDSAIARVCKLFDDGSDQAEDTIAVSSQVVSLKDPMSGLRMVVPARFKDASGLQAFDLDSFLSVVEQNRKWQDPSTLKNSTIHHLQVDIYIQTILELLKKHENIITVEVNKEGMWRPEGSNGKWWSIKTDPEDIKLNADASVKGTTKSPAIDSDGSETDEEVELKQAAAALRAVMAHSDMGGANPVQSEPEVIDLVSSEDEKEEVRQDESVDISPLVSVTNKRARTEEQQMGGSSAVQPLIRPAPGSIVRSVFMTDHSNPASQCVPQNNLGAVSGGAAFHSPHRPQANQLPGMVVSPVNHQLSQNSFYPNASPEPQLSERSRQALAEEQAFLAANPSVLDAVNVDDWLN